MNNTLRTDFLLLIPSFLISIVFLLNDISFIPNCIKLIILFTVFSSTAILFFYKNLNNFYNKFLIIIVYSFAIGAAIYVFLYSYDLLKYFSSITALKELIISTGAVGGIVFIIIQIAQVVFLPIPAIAILIVGLIIYGIWKTVIFCTLGVLIGSYISFLFGKTFGYKFASWFIGEQRVVKYTNILKDNGKYLLALVFIFPFFPDDLFCMIAGISPMTFKEFFLISTIIRPITIVVMCLLGGGAIISLDSLGGIIILLITVIIVLILISFIIKKNKKIKILFKKGY